MTKLETLSVGAVLCGRYEIIALLEQGLWSATYRVVNREGSGRSCVLKEFVPEDESMMKLGQAFQRELSLLANVSQPGIPLPPAFFSEGGRYYLVQEYVEGQTRDELVCTRTDAALAAAQNAMPVESAANSGATVIDGAPAGDRAAQHQPTRILVTFVLAVLAASGLWYWASSTRAPRESAQPSKVDAPLLCNQTPPPVGPSSVGTTAPWRFPYIDPVAVRAARQELVEATHLPGAVGMIRVCYPEGWVVQTAPTALEIQHPDGMAGYGIYFDEKRPELTLDLIFGQVYSALQRDIPDARVFASAPTASGMMFQLVGTYRGRRVYTILEIAMGQFLFGVMVVQGIEEYLPSVLAIAQEARTPSDGGCIITPWDEDTRCHYEAWKESRDRYIAQGGGNHDPLFHFLALMRCTMRDGR